MKYTLVIAALLYSSSALKITNLHKHPDEYEDAFRSEEAEVQVKVSS